jgi:predicted transcriptional regulator
MLACASNQDPESIKQVERLVEKTSGEVERTYEFFFNLGQVQMKQ